jgi:hypothetical protein
MFMTNPVDTRQMKALVDHKQQQVAADAVRTRNVDNVSTNQPEASPVRVAIGIQIMRFGARIAGVYSPVEPRLRPGQ